MPVTEAITREGLAPFPGVMDLRRRSDNKLVERISYTDALAWFEKAKLEQKFIEAVLSPTRAIKYLRVADIADKPKAEAPTPPPQKKAEVYTSHSTAIANTKMGVYRQQVVHEEPEEVNGFKIQTVIGWNWAFHALRGVGI